MIAGQRQSIESWRQRRLVSTTPTLRGFDDKGANGQGETKMARVGCLALGWGARVCACKWRRCAECSTVIRQTSPASADDCVRPPSFNDRLHCTTIRLIWLQQQAMSVVTTATFGLCCSPPQSSAATQPTSSFSDVRYVDDKVTANCTTEIFTS